MQQDLEWRFGLLNTITHIGKGNMSYNRVFFFNITYECNNNCYGCISKNTRLHTQRIVSLEDVLLIQNRFCFKGDDRFVISGGEPFLNHELNSIISALSIFSKHIILYTNGRKLKELPKSTISKIERIIIPLYGNQERHSRYINNSNGFKETIESIKTITDIKSEIIDLKLVINNNNIRDFISDFTLISLYDLVNCISFSGYLFPNDRQSHLSKSTVKIIEKKVLELLDKNKKIKLYDIPLCYFSEYFIGGILSKLNNQFSIGFDELICCSISGHYKIVDYNQSSTYFNKCDNCKVKQLCSMVLKRYYVLAITKQFAFLETE